MYVHTSYVLINPPIPYITSSPLCLLRAYICVASSFAHPYHILRPHAVKRCKRLHKFRPVEILLHKRTNPRVPPCKPLKKYVFKIYDVRHFINFFKKNPLHRTLKKRIFKIYDVTHFIIFLKKNHFENGVKTCRLYILYRYCIAVLLEYF